MGGSASWHDPIDLDLDYGNTALCSSDLPSTRRYCEDVIANRNFKNKGLKLIGDDLEWGFSPRKLLHFHIPKAPTAFRPFGRARVGYAEIDRGAHMQSKYKRGFLSSWLHPSSFSSHSSSSNVGHVLLFRVTDLRLQTGFARSCCIRRKASNLPCLRTSCYDDFIGPNQTQLTTSYSVRAHLHSQIAPMPDVIGAGAARLFLD